MNFEDLVDHIQISGFQLTLSKQLNKKDYAKFKAMMIRAGGQWTSDKQAFEFTRDPKALVSRLIEFGSANFNKFHLYETPDLVTNFIKEYSLSNFTNDPTTNTIKILEPNIGGGALVLPILEELKERYPDRTIELTAYDIDPINVCLCEQIGLNVTCLDFLSVDPEPIYDIVLLNPPFSGRTYQKHIFHAQKFLKKRDGALEIAIAPTHHIFNLREGFLSNKGDRQLYSEAFKVSKDFADPFDENTFSHANVKTSVFLLRYPDYQSQEGQNEHHFTCTNLELDSLSKETVIGLKHRDFYKVFKALKIYKDSPEKLQDVVDCMLDGFMKHYSNNSEILYPAYLPYWSEKNSALIDHLKRLLPEFSSYYDSHNANYRIQKAPYNFAIQQDNQFALVI